MATTPDLSEVAETLVDNGATYVAASAPSLVDEPAQLYYHLPAGTPNDQQETIATYLNEKVGHRPYEQQIGDICIAGEPTPVCVYHVLRGGLHLYRRVPVYVPERMAGLDPVAIEDGVTTVREIVETQPVYESRPAETVALKDVVEELAEAGAASVEMAHQFLVRGEPTVDLRIPVTPADAQPIVGPVDAVKFGGETYQLHTTLTLDGPYGSTPDWTALYVSDTVRGLEPVSVEDGCETGRNLLARAKAADSLRELEPPANR
ncbi:hypothetical protein [Halorubellus salinus]|uniref:hypothetical protein n=1 Tax=Halorubellus salinus TaxID=755309 RepID=UPI001D08FAC7|nr:hypothetical protein [Halorubellus salinus]